MSHFHTQTLEAPCAGWGGLVRAVRSDGLLQLTACSLKATQSDWITHSQRSSDRAGKSHEDEAQLLQAPSTSLFLQGQGLHRD